MESDLRSLVAALEGEDSLSALNAVATLRRELERLEAVHVRRARVGGALWSEIARALGVSKQAVHKKHGGRRILGRRDD
jgi:hypothetical protein